MNLDIVKNNKGSNISSLVSKLESTYKDESNDEKNSESNNESDNEDNYKLKIDKMKVPASELNIKNDPDEIDLDILDLKTEISTDDEKSDLDLDIEEL
jgi:RNA binding exosome subunit